jgi:hypothetical protein
MYLLLAWKELESDWTDDQHGFFHRGRLSGSFGDVRGDPPRLVGGEETASKLTAPASGHRDLWLRNRGRSDLVV